MIAIAPDKHRNFLFGPCDEKSNRTIFTREYSSLHLRRRIVPSGVKLVGISVVNIIRFRWL